MTALLLALVLGAGTTFTVDNTSKNPVPVNLVDAGVLTVTCTNCSSSGGGTSSVVTVDGGTLAVSNFPSMWPSTQVVLIDAGTVDARVTSLPAVVIDGGINVSSLPAVVIDGGVNISNWPGNLLTDGGVVNVGNFPASQVVTGTFWQSTQPISAASLPTHGITIAAGAISGGNPCQNASATINGLSGSTSGTSAVQLVALQSGQKIYVCSLTVTGASGTTPTFSLVTGTGSNCATGQAVLIGAWTTTANTVYAFNSSTVAIGPAGAALCYLDTGTTPVQRYTITYAQQ